MNSPTKIVPAPSIKVSFPDKGLAEENNKRIIGPGIDAFYGVIHSYLLPVVLFGGLIYFFWMLYVVDFSHKAG